MQNKLEKNERTCKKLKNNNLILKLSKEKYLNIKKINESSLMKNNDNIRKIKLLKKDLEEYKILYSQQNEKYNNLLKKKSNSIQFKPIKENELIKEIESVKIESDKSLLYKSLLEDEKIKNNIFEEFLRGKGLNPNEILKKKGYDGIINSKAKKELEKIKNSNLVNNNSSNAKEPTSPATKEINKSQNSNDLNKKNEIEEIKNGGNSKRDEIENRAKNNSFNHNEDLSNRIQNEEKMNRIDNETQLLALFHTFVKNFEANHWTKEVLINEIKKISQSFENKTEATKEEFIEPFVKLFISSMKVTKEKDIQLINEFFSNFIDELMGDTVTFFSELIDIFENIVDYTLVENEKEILDAISLELKPYKEKLLTKLKNKNETITFNDLREIIEELGISLSDDYTEFLIYKMKENAPKDSSIFDLNYSIILDLLNREIKEDNVKINEEKDEEKINIKISNALSELKKKLKNNETTFEEECKDNIRNFFDNNKNIKGINKDIFFGLFEKYNIQLENELKKSIFELFKLDENILLQSESELFLLDYNKLNFIL